MRTLLAAKINADNGYFVTLRGRQWYGPVATALFGWPSPSVSAEVLGARFAGLLVVHPRMRPVGHLPMITLPGDRPARITIHHPRLLAIVVISANGVVPG